MSIFSKLVKVGIDTVLTPVAVVADVVTLGGISSGKDKPYTQDQLEKIKKTLEDVYDKLDDD